MLGGGALAAYTIFGPPAMRNAAAGPGPDAQRAAQDMQSKQLLLAAGVLGSIGIAARVTGS